MSVDRPGRPRLTESEAISVGRPGRSTAPSCARSCTSVDWAVDQPPPPVDRAIDREHNLACSMRRFSLLCRPISVLPPSISSISSLPHRRQTSYLLFFSLLKQQYFRLTSSMNGQQIPCLISSGKESRAAQKRLHPPLQAQKQRISALQWSEQTLPNSTGMRHPSAHGK